MEHYTRGELVEALDYSAHTWRPAIVESDAPYPRINRGGAYIYWTDLPTPCCSSVSKGGWVGENCIRRIAPAQS